jgi:protoheme IX farnesyltransferase
LRDWLALTKFQISAVSTLTAAMGYIAVAGTISGGLVRTVLGTLCLAMAASTLNEVAERDTDARMLRTCARPIPSGTIGVRVAVTGAATLVALGMALLYWVNGLAPALVGLLALFWYNGLYTPMKRVTAFAVVPGAVIGALPPAIGWAAAGGDLESPALLSLCFVFFVWQVPHFWLLALRHHEDYDRAGFPTLSKYFSPLQIYRLIFTWTAASVAACALLWVFGAISGWVATSAIAVAGIWLLLRFRNALADSVEPSWLRRAFLDINQFALIVMMAVAFDALV